VIARPGRDAPPDGPAAAEARARCQSWQHRAEILLIVLLVFGYWLSVTQISVRLRLQLYETLLRKALPTPI
jgi:hypothetical protein